MTGSAPGRGRRYGDGMRALVQPLVTLSALRSIVVATSTAAGFLLGMATLGALLPWRDHRLWTASIVTAVMVRAAVVIATANPHLNAITTRRWIATATFLGMLNAPVVFIAVVIVDGSAGESIGALPMLIIFGAPVGLVLGLLFAVVLSPGLLALGLARRVPTPATLDRGAAIVGGSLATIAAATAGLGFRTFTRMNAASIPLSLVIAAVVGATGLVLMGLAWRRSSARRRFIAAVARHEAPGWSLVVSPSPTTALERLPCLDRPRDECCHVLFQHERPGDDAYRQVDCEWPVAWVPPSWVP